MSRTRRRLFIQILLFVVTLVTTTIAGAEWMHGTSLFYANPPLTFTQVLEGLYFSVPFLLVLTFHEFGHYFTARYNKVKVTLPFYIPLWFGPFTTMGTMGAFIQLRSRVKTNQQYFDIGIAGPLAGFFVALGLLWYGFTHLPPADYIFTIHPEWKALGNQYPQHVYTEEALAGRGAVKLGDNLLFWFFEKFVATGPVPSPYDMANYPFLFAGYLSLFFTALNLFPIGQLDGGHILYGLVGRRWHRIISPIIFVAFLFYAGLGWFKYQDFNQSNTDEFLIQAGYLAAYIGLNFMAMSRLHPDRWTVAALALGMVLMQLVISYFFPAVEGYRGFLLFAVMLGRFLGVYHPPAEIEVPIGWKRQLLGWFSLLVFVLCFSPKPFIMFE
ncbi:site-2 protease family protein [Siphonobacter sp. SORGH_AS_1065]|uniref:site-2 protease family protein n=1 Tax=Siphonobacter sp. SORGH_AS_1065 TaxID=3041795 RepID=UPI002789BC42|nr:site-2 protease family protein [Siphonobacter sp. SORGH_AS_1065]MDQ1089304.1 Zn-dependent protease [Siphonobacter sp. SORGH_AS_1065]